MPEGDSIAGDASRLRPLLEGKTIEAVAGTTGAVRANSRRLLGAEVTSIRTHGKNLVIDLSSGYSVRVHLGMTGQFTAVPRSEDEPDHLHIVFELDKGRELRFRDPENKGNGGSREKSEHRRNRTLVCD